MFKEKRDKVECFCDGILNLYSLGTNLTHTESTGIKCRDISDMLTPGKSSLQSCAPTVARLSEI